MEYLPVHMCPQYILSDNGTEFKKNLMNQVLQQLGIDRILSAPYHPQRKWQTRGLPQVHDTCIEEVL